MRRSYMHILDGLDPIESPYLRSVMYYATLLHPNNLDPVIEYNGKGYGALVWRLSQPNMVFEAVEHVNRSFRLYFTTGFAEHVMVASDQNEAYDIIKDWGESV